MIWTALFAPAAIVGLVAFLRVRRVWPQRVVLAINIALPALWLGYWWPLMAVVGPPILPAALAGHCDGETWSEGFVSYSAMAYWTARWIEVALALIVVARK